MKAIDKAHSFTDCAVLEIRDKLVQWYRKNKRDLPWRKQVGAIFLLEITVLNPISTHAQTHTGPYSAVGNMSDFRCASDCRSRGREFGPGPVPYFHGD